MGFISIGTQRDSLGRVCEAFIHTDDFTDEDYSKYCKLEKEYEKALEDRKSGKDSARVLLGVRSLKDIQKERFQFMKYLKQTYGGIIC